MAICSYVFDISLRVTEGKGPRRSLVLTLLSVFVAVIKTDHNRKQLTIKLIFLF